MNSNTVSIEHASMSEEKNDIKRKHKGLTWAEASKIVLERSDRPMTHKEILKIIKEENLRDVSNPSTLACLNAMLHHHSRGPEALFYKVDGRMSCYGLKKPRDATINGLPYADRPLSSPSESSISNHQSSVSSDSEESSISAVNNLSPPPPILIDNMPVAMEEEIIETPAVFDVPDIAREETLSCTSPTENEPVFQPKLVTPLVAPKPKKASNSRSKNNSSKRGPKQKSRQPAKRPRLSNTRPRTVPKIVLKNLKVGNGPEHENRKGNGKVKKPDVQPAASVNNSQNDTEPHTTPQIAAARNMVKFSGLVTKKQRRYKKMGVADQIKRTKEGRVDLQSPESILASIPLRSILNHRTFNMLPPAYQYQLLMLLPNCDRVVGPDKGLRPSITSFTNEFFTSNCQMWRERLRDGEFTPEMQQKLKLEEEKQTKLDPWKAKYFEPIWGQKTLSKLDSMMPPFSPITPFGLLPDYPAGMGANLTIPWQPPSMISKTVFESVKLPGKSTHITSALIQPLTVPVRKLSAQLTKGKYKSKQVRVTASRRSDAAKTLNEKANAVSIVLTETQATEALAAVRTCEPSDMITAVAFLTRKRTIRIPVAPAPRSAKHVNYRGKSSTSTVSVKTEDINPVLSLNSLSESQASQASKAVASPLPPSKAKKNITKEAVSKTLSSLIQGNPTVASLVSRNFKGPIPKHCVCRMKAMRVCRSCGAFCHDDCISAAQLCTTCVN